ncbi:FAD-dependent oxidoreductase [Ruania alba]|uniref:Choline dehydrogenase n=1 Tax=Ruania alba TaxID=648782 RepID=A0A1H5LLH3_9MICO|nr:FAD-dependent oxidoreductase [Ruania alba]SEE77906.1 Choline dehydrogenase [Ruania alba]
MTSTDRIRVLTHADEPLRADVVIIGSGAAGAAVAGEVSRAGASVVMIEAGGLPHDQHLGAHIRNSYPAESQLQTEFGPRILANLVPYQHDPEPLPGLRGQRFTHAVGGMLTFWSHVCAVPDAATEAEPSIPLAELVELWDEAARLLWSEAGIGGVRHQRLVAALTAEIGDLPAGREVQGLPIGARRTADGSLQFSGIDALLDGSDRAGEIQILAEHPARRIDHTGGRAHTVHTARADGSNPVAVSGDVVVVAAGALASPAVLWASGIRPPALGRYLTDHTMLSSRVKLAEPVVEGVTETDELFGVWIPSSSSRPVHTQVVPGWTTGLAFPGTPAWQTADIGQFIGVDPDPGNRLVFDDDHLDRWGLPSVQAQFRLGETDRARTHEAYADHARVADAIRDRTHGLSISLAAPGGSLHLMGSTRIGTDETSSADPTGLIWGTDNVYVAGNGVLSTRNTSNPTLSMVALALRTARTITGAGA